MSRMQAVKLVLGTMIASGFMWLVLRQLDGHELRTIISQARPAYLVAALLAFALGYSCRIARWQVMLTQHSPQLRWRDCAGPLLASFAANNVLPLRAGDIMRTFAFTRQLGASSSTVMATLFVERLLDLLMVLLLLSAALYWFDLEANHLLGLGALMLAMLALAILMVLFFPALMAPLAGAITRGITALLPGFGEKLTPWVDNAFQTLVHLAGFQRMRVLMAWSVAAWLAEGGVFYCVALALSALPVATASWLALPIGTLATLIPGTPGYVGTFDYFVVQAMTALANPLAAATVYALLVHSVLWLPPTLVGGGYLLVHPARSLILRKKLL